MIDAKITCRDTAALMASDSLFAIFDVRERGEFNNSQIPNATSLPRSQIEFHIGSLVPNRKIPIVVYDEGGERAALAAKTLAELGYEQIAVMDGGLTAWQSDGRPVVSGVNVPSKAFGEKIHKERSLPEITPEELKSWQREGKDLIILDVRTPEEYSRFCIPGGVNVPGGDLILWASALSQKPETAVIVNCAGRTRSIIGTAALRRLGLNHARALKNGTMGWVLADLELESKPARAAGTVPAESSARANELARQIAQDENIPWVGVDELVEILNRSHHSEVTYLIDVRSEKEYAAGHMPTSFNVPGGQAVQRADDFVAVKHGRIVFISSASARAVMATYWYRQMGFRNASVLQGGLRKWVESGQPLASGVSRHEPLGFEAIRRTVSFISPGELDRRLRNSSLLVVDVGPSVDFGQAHVPTAHWISRGWLDLKLPERFPDRARPIVVTCPDGKNSVLAARFPDRARPIVVTCPNGQNSVLAARALTNNGYAKVFVLDGGVGSWVAADHSTEDGLQSFLVEPNDIVFSPSIRGNKEDMKRYLEWEVKLE